MIKLTWGHLKNDEFMQSLGAFYKTKMGVLYSTNIAKVYKKVSKELALCNEVHNKLLNNLGTPDEKKPGNFIIPDEKKPEFAVEYEKLLATEFTIDVPKFDLKKIGELVLLSPQDIMMLEELFIQDLEDSADVAQTSVPEETPVAH